MFKFVVRFVGLIIGFRWLIINLKRIINAWGWIPVLFLTVWGISIFWPNVGPWTPYLVQKYFKVYKNCQLIFSKHNFVNMEISSTEYFEKMCTDSLKMLELKSKIFETLKIINLELWNLQDLKLLKDWNVETCNTSKLKIVEK